MTDFYLTARVHLLYENALKILKTNLKDHLNEIQLPFAHESGMASVLSELGL